MNERQTLIIKLITTHILLLPVLLVLSILSDKAGFGLLLIVQCILFILLFAGYWEFFGIRFKRIFLLLCQILILIILKERFTSDEVLVPDIAWLLVTVIVIFYLLSLIARILISIFNSDKEKLEINFPFSNGDYLITDGGNSKVSRLMNYHFHSPVHKSKKTNLSMLYATDIVKTGTGKTKFLPYKNEDYPVFSDAVYCPMDGTVVKVVDNIDDNLPYSGNYPYNTGNTVVIKNNHYYLLCGHLKKGSIVVNEGDRVNRDELLGEAGNSGMSERPHLHMQLIKCDGPDYWQGLGINMQYKGRNLYKNRLIRIPTS